MDVQSIKRLRRYLTLHFSVIACLAAILVANNGSGNIFLPVLMVLVTTSAFIFVDVLEVFHLGQVGSYIGMAAATVIALSTLAVTAFRHTSEATQLMSVAGLLIYPQCVLFFQRKGIRVFEQLAIFLLLQMIVAALINDNILYGILLTPLILAWVSSLFVFARYSTMVLMQPSIEEPIPLLYELLYSKFVKNRRVDTTDVRQSIVTRQVGEHTITTSNQRRWLQLSTPLGIVTLLFAGALFSALPRNSIGNLLGQPTFDRTGIGDRIDAAFYGKLLSDPTPILRLKFTKDGKSFRPIEPPYLRVDVFDFYHYGNYGFSHAQWSRSHNLRAESPLRSSPTMDSRDYIYADIKTKPSDSSRQKSIVSLPPLFDKSPQLNYDSYSEVFDQVVPGHNYASNKLLNYHFHTGGFFHGEQVRITAAPHTSISDTLIDLSVAFRRLDQVRLQVLTDAGIDQPDSLSAAEALTSYFRDSGQFSHSMDVPPPTETTFDPNEDFVINTKTGICQHYASALTIMLRKSGIPARIVAGYRPVEWNTYGEFFQVRLSDSHAWVEAAFTKDQLVGSQFEPWLNEAQLYWIQFDPTPPSAESNFRIVDENRALDYAEDLWEDYLSKSQSSQIASFVPSAAASQQQAANIASTLGAMKESFRQWYGSLGFAWRVALAVFALGVLPIALWQLLLFLLRLSPFLSKRLRSKPTSTLIKQRFYARCVALLESLNLYKQPGETLLEFNDRAQRAIESKIPVTGALTHSLSTLLDAYHRIRFGAATENSDLTPEIENHLRVVERAVHDACRVR